MNIEGSVVAITGASAGIGLAAARAFSRAGANVAIAARRKDRLDALILEIEAAGRKAVAMEADVSIEAMVRAVRHPRPEVHPYLMARALVALNAIWPSWVDRWAERAAKSQVTFRRGRSSRGASDPRPGPRA